MLFRIFAWFFLEHTDVKFESSWVPVQMECCCHDKCLIEVKCPYNCSTQLFSELEGNKSFCLKQINKHLKLDKAHSYYYQVQCQLNICELDICYFVVWSPEEMHIEEVKKDTEFFSALLPGINSFLLKGVFTGGDCSLVHQDSCNCNDR